MSWAAFIQVSSEQGGLSEAAQIVESVDHEASDDRIANRIKPDSALVPYDSGLGTARNGAEARMELRSQKDRLGHGVSASDFPDVRQTAQAVSLADSLLAKLIETVLIGNQDPIGIARIAGLTPALCFC